MAALASDWLRHFRLLLWNGWTEFTETWQEARSQCPLPSLCFSSRSEKQDGRPGLWLAETFLTSPLKPLNGIQRNLTGSKISMSSTKFVFFGPIQKQDGRPGLWLAESFSTSPLKSLNGIQRNLIESKISTSSTKFVFFRADRRNKMAVLASDWLRHFWLLLWNRWTEFNKTWQDARSQRPLPSLCFSGRSKNKMAALASDWLRHFWLLLWNGWTELNESWQEARSQRPLPSLCFSGRSEKQDGRPGLWFAEKLKLLNGNQRNLTGSKIFTSSISLCCSGRSEKQDGRPGLWLAESFSTSSLKLLNGIQWNLTGSKIVMSSTKFVFYRADRKNKIAALASDCLRHFRLLLWNRWTEFNESWQEARSQCPLPSLCFSGRSEKQDGRPGLWLAETFSTSPLKSLNGIQRNLIESKISTSSTKFVFFFRADRRNKMAVLASDWLRHFRLLLWNRWTEFNKTWQDARSQRPLPSLCFSGRSKNKMAALASDWLRYFRLLLWNDWTELNESWQEARSQHPLPSLCFSGRSEKQDGHPGLWFAEKLKLLNGNQRNLTGSKIFTSSTKFVLFGPIGKTRWPPWPLIGWVLFDFFSETTEWNSMKLDRKQDRNVLYQVRVLSGWSEKQDGGPGLWLSETFSTSSLKPLNGIQWKLTGSKISMSSTKFVFFGPIRKTRWPPWPLIVWDIFDFFSETAEWNSTKTWQEVRSQGPLLSLCF